MNRDDLLRQAGSYILMDYCSRYMPVNSEATLVKQAQSGNRLAFDTLVRKYRPLLLGLAYMRTSSLDATEDLAQEVLTRAWCRISHLQNPQAFEPWLNTITINVCSNWHGRYRSPQYLREQPEYEALADTSPTPQEVVLAAERRYEVDRALSLLPDINRLALVLHALEGYSYEEIARQVGVPVSTIDGRIRRAKAQLRRFLINDDTGLLHAPRPDYTRTQELELPKLRREPMTAITQVPDLTVQARSLTLFTNRLAMLIEAGLPVSRALAALGDAPDSYGASTRDLCQHLTESAGDGSATPANADQMQLNMYINWLYNKDMYPTLVKHISSAIEEERYLLPSRSQGLVNALKQRPDLFSPYYADVVYHGDNAGQLDATLRRLAELLEKQQQLAAKRPEGEEPLLFFLPTLSPPAKEWNDLTAYQQRVTLMLLMRGLAVALACGVPILQSMRLMQVVLPEATALHWRQAIEDIKKGDPIVSSLRRMEVLPEFAIQLTSIGEELGTLDSTLMRAAELMEDVEEL